MVSNTAMRWGTNDNCIPVCRLEEIRILDVEVPIIDQDLARMTSPCKTLPKFAQGRLVHVEAHVINLRIGALKP